MLRVVIIPYDRILSWPVIQAISSKCACCCRCSKTKSLTKLKNALKTRVSCKLQTVRQARKSLHETEDVNDETKDVNDETDEASVEISQKLVKENQETEYLLIEQSGHEQSEDDIYDRRNFRLFGGLYVIGLFVAMVFSIESATNISSCEREDVFHITQGYHDIT